FNIKIWLLFLVMPCVLMTISGSPAYSQNITWDEAISNVSRLEDLYWKSFRDQTGHISIGTAANNADLDNHRCAISGRILGFQHLVSIFEPPLTPLVGSDPYDIGWQAASLSNWISVAETFRAKPRAYLSAFWNTQCAT